MRKREYDKLTFAINCIMNGDPGHDDHRPEFGLWEDGMGVLNDLCQQYIKECKIKATNSRMPKRNEGCQYSNQHAKYKTKKEINKFFNL